MIAFKPFLFFLGIVLVGCTLTTSGDVPVTVIVLEPTATPTTSPPEPATPPPPTPNPTATVSPYPWEDARDVMAGICFEAAFDAAGRVFVLRSAEDHINFYNNADNSGLCRLPVTRNPFEFKGGTRTLAGLWAVGGGCDSDFEVVDYTLSDAVLTVSIRLIETGDCNYELVEPFWIGIDHVNEVQITLLEATP